MLEDYVGIRDHELALSIYETGASANDSGSFHANISEAYPMFAFNDQFVIDVWSIISDAEGGKIPTKKTYWTLNLILTLSLMKNPGCPVAYIVPKIILTV